MPHNKIKHFYFDIGGLINVSYLDASNNYLEVIAPETGLMTKLQSLKLNYNNLETLPPELGSCSDLQSLELQYNKIVGCLPGMSCKYILFHSVVMCTLLFIGILVYM